MADRSRIGLDFDRICEAFAERPQPAPPTRSVLDFADVPEAFEEHTMGRQTTPPRPQPPPYTAPNDAPTNAAEMENELHGKIKLTLEVVQEMARRSNMLGMRVSFEWEGATRVLVTVQDGMRNSGRVLFTGTVDVCENLLNLRMLAHPMHAFLSVGIPLFDPRVHTSAQAYTRADYFLYCCCLMIEKERGTKPAFLYRS